MYLQKTQNASRKVRRPAHPHYIKQRPWQLVPFMIAPVLPGDTMRNLVLQARCVTDPITNRLMGWSLEHYYFYVKHRDLEETLLETMVLDPEADVSSLNTTADSDFYHYGGTIPYTKMCYEKIVDAFFRTEDEAWDVVKIGNYASVNFMTRKNALDSMTTDTNYAANIVEDETLVVGVDDEFTMGEFETLWNQYQFQKAHGVTDMDYEDWLGTYGVNIPKEEDAEKRNDPELIRYTRNWSYPSNTIDPSDGSAASACVWSVTERADKDRFFKEPGFIVGLSCIRPKVLMGNQEGSLVGLMTDHKTWLPTFLSHDMTVSHVNVAATTAPFANQTDAYWIDIRDLFMYGDQFSNYDISAENGLKVALPTAAAQKRYPASTDADSLFVNTTAGIGTCVQDGITTLMIASKVRDWSATV